MSDYTDLKTMLDRFKVGYEEKSYEVMQKLILEAGAAKVFGYKQGFIELNFKVDDGSFCHVGIYSGYSNEKATPPTPVPGIPAAAPAKRSALPPPPPAAPKKRHAPPPVPKPASEAAELGSLFADFKKGK